MQGSGEVAYKYSAGELIPAGYKFLRKVSSGSFRGNIR